MDWVMFIILGLSSGLAILLALSMVVSWATKNLFGKSDSWLEYGIDEDEM